MFEVDQFDVFVEKANKAKLGQKKNNMFSIWMNLEGNTIQSSTLNSLAKNLLGLSEKSVLRHFDYVKFSELFATVVLVVEHVYVSSMCMAVESWRILESKEVKHD